MMKRFWEKVAKKGPQECWEWTAHRTNGGYGRLTFRGQQWIASRLVWTEERGAIPEGMYVLHHCDNRGCVNPGHLYLGTIKQNYVDMVTRGRRRLPRGERHRNSKLTEAAIREIRGSKTSSVVLGKKYGVDHTTVCRVRRGVAWIKREVP